MATLYKRYITIDSETVALDVNGSRYQYVADMLGSIIEAYDNTGVKVDDAEYWPFGEYRTHTNSIISELNFIGSAGYYGNNDFLYIRNRYYYSHIGKWMTEDALQFDSGINFYEYCANNPANSIDPLGLDKIKIIIGNPKKVKGAPEQIYYGHMVCCNDAGKVLWDFPIDSGGHSDPTPGGDWLIRQPPWSSSMGPATGGWFTGIDPTFKCGRTSIGIHFDGNVPGTHGCIGILSWEDYKQWLDYMKRYGKEIGIIHRGKNDYFKTPIKVCIMYSGVSDPNKDHKKKKKDRKSIE